MPDHCGRRKRDHAHAACSYSWICPPRTFRLVTELGGESNASSPLSTPTSEDRDYAPRVEARVGNAYLRESTSRKSQRWREKREREKVPHEGSISWSLSVRAGMRVILIGLLLGLCACASPKPDALAADYKFEPYPGSQWYEPDGEAVPKESGVINAIT